MTKILRKKFSRACQKRVQALVRAKKRKNLHFFRRTFICSLSTINNIEIHSIEKKLFKSAPLDVILTTTSGWSLHGIYFECLQFLSTIFKNNLQKICFSGTMMYLWPFKTFSKDDVPMVHLKNKKIQIKCSSRNRKSTYIWLI